MEIPEKSIYLSKIPFVPLLYGHPVEGSVGFQNPVRMVFS